MEHKNARQSFNYPIVVWLKWLPYNMSVGLESNFFRLKPFQISKIFANIDMISGVYKKLFWETVET